METMKNVNQILASKSTAKKYKDKQTDDEKEFGYKKEINENEETELDVEFQPNVATIIHVKSTTETICTQKSNTYFSSSLSPLHEGPNNKTSNTDLQVVSSLRPPKEETTYNPSEVFLTWFNEGRKHKDDIKKSYRKIKLTYSKQEMDGTTNKENSQTKDHKVNELYQRTNSSNLFNTFSSVFFGRNNSQYGMKKNSYSSLEDSLSLINIPLVKLEKEDINRDKTFSKYRPSWV